MAQPIEQYRAVYAAVDELASPDPRIRDSAAAMLAAAGPIVVEPLVYGVLHEQDTPADVALCASVLRQIGPPAFGDLLELIACDWSPEITGRGCLALGIAPSDEVIRYAQELVSEDANERGELAWLIGYRRRLEYVSLLIVLLSDPAEPVRAKAVAALGRLGPSVVPLLRRVRRATEPTARRGALAAMAEIGWDTLDSAEQTLLRRLIRLTLAREVPTPFTVQGEWYAVRTTDQAAVLAAFGLAHPVPATLAMGRDGRVWDGAGYPGDRGYEDHADCARMYVSPVLDGWTLVFGIPVVEQELAAHDRKVAALLVDSADEDEATTPAEDAGSAEHAARQAFCAELSRQFGAAQWYAHVEDGGCSDWWGWCIAEDGAVARYCYSDHNMPAGSFDAGPVHRGERGPALPGRADVATPFRIADQVSVSPTGLGPHTRVAGHGVLALTACGQRFGHRGALPISSGC
ncbi:HEAT repeat domain-containing protein [Nocardia sp. CS682]|uniref:HEAT repeat domain-containing protein n=1 Tax=Nocardia sp. CS682 TaxID=1047172 RepID=UPI001074E081|nr:HEAT repeat domain-containing protein [Nocardia sp. CS682]QBS41379.1 hypothetical protein DMB37_15845 [Nocardia sp. CS682]